MNDGTPRIAEALALYEIDGVPRAVLCQDAALKRAAVEILACAPTSPGRVILVFVGDVASVEEAMAAVDAAVGSRQIDRMFLPGIHPDVIHALTGERRPRGAEALAIFELVTVAATILAADAAVKNARVVIGRLHPASGFGGKGYFTVWGAQPDVEAAVEAAEEQAGERLLDVEVIPAPHDDLELAAFRRPWPLDPADSGDRG